MPELIAPTTRLHSSWLESRAEWGVDTHQAGAGLRGDEDVETPAGFAAWVAGLNAQSDPSVLPEPGRVHCTSWWIVQDDIYLGAIALRHELNDYLREVGGHIGYGIRPSARRQGLATWALDAVLPHARALGLSRVLVTCEVGNVASARIIEKAGGIFEGARDTDLGVIRRYWIELNQE